MAAKEGAQQPLTLDCYVDADFLGMATAPNMTSRTRHICAKYHFFKEKLNDPKVPITIQHISTTEQNADAFTKGLPIAQFIKLRNKFMGWDLSDTTSSAQSASA